MKKKILIIGHARHGKDTVAEMLKNLCGYTHKSSSVMALEVFLFDLLNTKYNKGYKTKEEAFEDRVNCRDIWFNEISNYNKDDKSRLAKEIMESNDIYVGLRSKVEVEKCIKDGVFDIVIGVHNDNLPLEDPSSNNVNPYLFADVIIANNGTLAELEDNVKSVKEMLKL